MSELTYSSIRVSHNIRENEEKKAKEKKRQTLYLVLGFLRDEGYFESARAFRDEAQLTNQYQICDNIDLPNIIHEYEAYYHMRFQKYPKICKKNITPDDLECLPSSSKRDLKKRNISSSKIYASPKIQENKQQPKSGSAHSHLISATQHPRSNLIDSELTVTPLRTPDTSVKSSDMQNTLSYDKILKPLGAYVGLTSEWREYAETISKEICMTNLNTRWSDIMGLDEAKRLLKEAVVYPIKYPELFSGILSPWKGLLLYGPSGTGKTLLAKAVATECQTTFFNISASSIVSKWRGDSEKLVRVMFELARYHAPSTIFLDELDALASHRDVAEHEGSRRLKSELLIQLDGISQSDDKVFLLATSNLPWELDVAMLRRLEKRILVDLPNLQAREAMFRHHLPPIVMRKPVLRSELDYTRLAHATANYSGSDIKLICKEAAMAAMRQVFSVLETHQSDSKLPNLLLKPITTLDVEQALAKTQPSASHLANKYQKWQKDFGSV